jgi:hypothetical protein
MHEGHQGDLQAHFSNADQRRHFIENAPITPIPAKTPRSPLEEGVRQIINAYSGEKYSNTPDYILAEYLMHCLNAFVIATQNRDTHYGLTLSPGRIHVHSGHEGDVERPPR